MPEFASDLNGDHARSPPEGEKNSLNRLAEWRGYPAILL
ncbi:hypothetical protein GTPT_0515 [Tatumella ptyseos ATCC 33301]|uniref:Uncharacterized protein n=1 Tax=Tatumella ptyseos ATCC 33301 TaxID=1005995 RepID=A0A085JPE5_9GAMM|nr:hypothetical protein GTPT_0515 [Tatumella ptyseos ATCC 33301]